MNEEANDVAQKSSGFQNEKIKFERANQVSCRKLFPKLANRLPLLNI